MIYFLYIFIFDTPRMYKLQEEKKLFDTLLASKMISQDELWYIEKLYCRFVPYHNFIHALHIASLVLQLPMTHFSIIEIKSLFLAALFHDAGHRGTASDLDEFRSLDMAIEGILEFEKKYDYQWIDFRIVRKAIVGTVFRNRGKNSDPYAILLADLDTATIWMNFFEFLYYADFPMMHELMIHSLDDWLKNIGYFKFLLSVEKNIFKTEILREIFPHALQNIRLYIDKNNISDIQICYDIWKQYDYSYDQYESHLRTILPNYKKYIEYS